MLHARAGCKGGVSSTAEATCATHLRSVAAVSRVTYPHPTLTLTPRTRDTTGRSAAAALAEDKASLEAQLHGVLQAEQELTVHLRETHTAIEGQLSTLREQLKVGPLPEIRNCTARGIPWGLISLETSAAR